MLAWTYNRTGHPSDVLKLDSSFPTPSPTGSQVLVKIKYAALNVGGSIMMQLFPSFIHKFPAIPETDFAGTVVELGSDVQRDDIEKGTPVFGFVAVKAHLSTGAGALAEYVAVDVSSVVPVPDGIGLDQVVGLPVAGCTALALLDRVKINEGDRVLVNGASGGIGSMIVQMVRAAGAREVIGICSTKNLDMVKQLGVDEVIDYQANSPVHEYLARRYGDNKFDAVIDAYGVQEFYTNCADYLAPGKPFVNVGISFYRFTLGSLLFSVWQMIKNQIVPAVLGGTRREYANVMGIANLEDMKRLARMVQDRQLRVPIDSCWKMDDVPQAYEIVRSRRARGKVIVQVAA